jgi:hypothetical protein
MRVTRIVLPLVKLAGLFVVLASASAMFISCADRTTSFYFDNRAPYVLCYYAADESEALGRCANEVDAQQVTEWAPECGADQPLTTILTVRESGERIYTRTATCSEWNDTDRKFVIEQRDGKFVVTGPGE